MTDTEILDISLYLANRRRELAGASLVFAPSVLTLVDKADALLAETRNCRAAIGNWRQANAELSTHCAGLTRQLQELGREKSYLSEELDGALSREAHWKRSHDQAVQIHRQFASQVNALSEQLREEKEKVQQDSALADLRREEIERLHGLLIEEKEKVAIQEELLESYRDLDRRQVAEMGRLKGLLADSESKVNILGHLDPDQQLEIDGLKKKLEEHRVGVESLLEDNGNLWAENSRIKAEVAERARLREADGVELDRLRREIGLTYAELDGKAWASRDEVSDGLDYAIAALLDRDSSAVDRIANATAILVRLQCGLEGGDDEE